MIKYAVAGVGYGRALDSEGNVIFNTTTLTDSGFNATTSLEDIRGGYGNALQGVYAHTSAFTVTMKDALADMNYLALQVGGNIVAGGDVFATETITTTVKNQIAVVGTPVSYGGYGIVGWYTVQGTNSNPTLITFTNKTANVSGVAVGTTVCVTYVVTSDTARVFEVASTFIPSIVHLIFTLPLITAGQSDSGNNASKVGEWVVDVPKFMFNGAIDMTATSAGVAKGDISGRALASGVTTCTGSSIYATITENLYKANVFDNVVAIGIADGDIDLAVNGTQTLSVYGFYNDGTAPSKIPNSYFTFSSGKTATATVTNAGIVTAVATGTSNIEVVATSKPALSTYAVVTVA